MFTCRICGDEFPGGRDDLFLGHVKVCMRRNMDELEQERDELNRDVWDHDDEKYDWLRRRAGEA